MRKLILSGLLFIGAIAYGQQDAMFTHYAFNTLAVNSGYAGSRDALTITALHRNQWVGFDGAPVTNSLTLHAPLMNDKLGLGLSVLNDKIGPTNVTSLYLDMAYRMPVSDKGTLAFGLKGGINVARAGLTDVDLKNSNQSDDSFGEDISTGILPNFGVGLYYSTTKWYTGLSTPRLIEQQFKTEVVDGSNDLAKEKRHFFFIAGTVFDLSNDIKLKPTTFLKVTEAAPIELDVTGMFIYKDKVELGAMFRTGDAVGVLLGYNFTNQLRLGYSFDWSFVNSTAKGYNKGSHEIMLRYDAIFNDKNKIRSPRYF